MAASNKAAAKRARAEAKAAKLAAAKAEPIAIYPPAEPLDDPTLGLASRLAQDNAQDQASPALAPQGIHLTCSMYLISYTSTEMHPKLPSQASHHDPRKILKMGI